VVTSDDILLTQGPRMLVSGLLEGFVGLTLCMGVVALGLVAARSVVERRQQIGLLRALGYRRRTVGLSLLLEASFVALLTTLVPAWQATRIVPAEALRYQ